MQVATRACARGPVQFLWHLRAKPSDPAPVQVGNIYFDAEHARAASHDSPSRLEGANSQSDLRKLLASQSAGIRRGICVVVVCFFVHVSETAQVSGAAASKTPSLNGNGKGPSAHLSFVREFSSAHDVKRPLPSVLDRTLDIIAGPKEHWPTDALQTPHAVTTDSTYHVFVTDVSAKVVHVFDFAHSKYSRLDGGSDRLRSPLGVATDREGKVYVTDNSSGAIFEASVARCAGNARSTVAVPTSLSC